MATESLRFEAVVHPHSESPQGQTKHHACSDEFERIDGMNAGELWSADDYREREQTHDQRKNDVSPCRSAICHDNEDNGCDRVRQRVWINRDYMMGESMDE
jgi:hypothetical protein